MMNKSKLLVPLLAISLAGCSSSSDEISTERKFSNKITRSAKMEDRLFAYDRTVWDEVPFTGSAEFKGYATLVMDTSPAAAWLIGNADVKIDFDTSDVTGKMTNFVGTDAGGNLEEYTGSIDILNGDVGRIRPNDFYANYDGQLSAPGDNITIAGELEGDLVRTPLYGIEAEDYGVTATHNGTPTLADLKIVGQIE